MGARAWVLAVLMAGGAVPCAAQDTLFVSPAGNDQADGRTRASAVRSLEHVRDLVRGRPRGSGVVVFLLPGEYERGASFVLGPEDGGSPDAPVIYAGDPAGGSRIVGTRVVALSTPVTDSAVLRRLPRAARGKVRQIPLGTEVAQNPGGGDWTRPRIPELFDTAVPLRLARWPAQGWASIGAVTGDARRATVTLAPSPSFRPARGAQLEGYFHWDWAWSFAPVVGSTQGGGVIAGGENTSYGWRTGQRIVLTNVLQMVDGPGKYATDSATRSLYVWPPAGASTLRIAAMSTPLIRLDGASNVRFQDLEFGPSGGTAIALKGGAGVELTRLTIRWTGSDGIVVAEGKEVAISHSRLEGIAGVALRVEGGDRRTLTSSGIVIEDNVIRGAARIRRTMRSVSLAGVGIRFAHNEIADAEFEGILITGNDHVVEGNDLHDLLRGGRDAGAIYMGRDWTERGTVIRGNWIHDIGGLPLTSSALVSGVYLDDGESGITIQDNVVSGVPSGIHLHGGHDDLVDGNLFVCTAPALYLSWIGEWAPFTALMRARLDSARGAGSPYARYPGLMTLDRADPWTPRGNGAHDNTVVGGALVRRDQARPWAIDTTGNVARTATECRAHPPRAFVDAALREAQRRSGRPRISLDSVGPRR